MHRRYTGGVPRSRSAPTNDATCKGAAVQLACVGTITHGDITCGTVTDETADKITANIHIGDDIFN